MAFEGYQVRVIKERDELNDRLRRLRIYLTTGHYDGLSRVDREDLFNQSVHMNNYLDVLNRRIGRFNG